MQGCRWWVGAPGGWAAGEERGRGLFLPIFLGLAFFSQTKWALAQAWQGWCEGPWVRGARTRLWAKDRLWRPSPPRALVQSVCGGGWLAKHRLRMCAFVCFVRHLAGMSWSTRATAYRRRHFVWYHWFLSGFVCVHRCFSLCRAAMAQSLERPLAHAACLLQPAAPRPGTVCTAPRLFGPWSSFVLCRTPAPYRMPTWRGMAPVVCRQPPSAGGLWCS